MTREDGGLTFVEASKRCGTALCACLFSIALALFAPSHALAFDPCGEEPPAATEVSTYVTPLALESPLTSRSSSQVNGVVRRLWGETRFDTMEAVASTGFTRASTVILASGENYPDALSAAAIAGINESPVLLTGSDYLPSQTSETIKLLGARRVVILGGEAAVAQSVADELVGMGLRVSRIQGQTREQTAARIAREVSATVPADTIVIANGYVPWDSLSVSSYSYAKGYPIFLTSSNGLLSQDSLDAIRSLGGVRRAIVVGGPAVVSPDIANQLSGISVDRWWGATRYETSIQIANNALRDGLPSSTVAVASGENFPDALTGGALVGSRSGVLLLSSFDGRQASEFLTQHESSISHCFILGGPSALSSGTEAAFESLLGSSLSLDDGSVPSNADIIVFAPHQDDETLSMGSFIEQAIQNGCRVHVVLCTDGSRSWVKRELSNGQTCSFHEGSHVYELTDAEFVSSRDMEFEEGCKSLGVAADGISIPDDRSHDGALSIDEARRLISEYLALYPNAIVCTISPLTGTSQHSDHRSLGNAALELYREGLIQDLRLFVEPYNLDEFQRRNRGLTLSDVKAAAGDSALFSACEAYSLWTPGNKRFAIGYHSVGGSFDALLGSGYASYWHTGASIY